MSTDAFIESLRPLADLLAGVSLDAPAAAQADQRDRQGLGRLAERGDRGGEDPPGRGA